MLVLKFGNLQGAVLKFEHLCLLQKKTQAKDLLSGFWGWTSRGWAWTKGGIADSLEEWGVESNTLLTGGVYMESDLTNRESNNLLRSSAWRNMSITCAQSCGNVWFGFCGWDDSTSSIFLVLVSKKGKKTELFLYIWSLSQKLRFFLIKAALIWWEMKI